MEATQTIYEDLHSVREEKLNRAIEAFYRNGDLREFMEMSSVFIFRFIKRLNGDPDLAGDFYLHFYEKADRCLDAYSRNTHIPFPQFLNKYIKNELLNFKRVRKNRTLNMYPSSHTHHLDEELIPEMRDPDHYTAESRHARLRERICHLPIRYRLPVKLYFGFDLSLRDIRYFLSQFPEEMNAESFLGEFERRIASTSAKLQKLDNRAARLNHLIHTAVDLDQSLYRKRMKRRIEKFLRRNRPIFSLSELGMALGLSKTTVFRRIRFATRIVMEKEVR
jgi:DNA-directed RNA polymerase specialized sigma24 family protein